MQITSHNNNSSLPVVGSSGHLLGKGIRSGNQVKELEKLKQSIAAGCPVNKGVPATMTKQGFERACKRYFSIAKKNEDSKNNHSISTTFGFRSKNKRACSKCKIGERIEKGWKYTPPKGIKFDDLRSPDQIPHPKLKRRKVPTKSKKKGKIFGKEDVLRIRKLAEEGYSISAIMEIYPNKSKSSLYRLVNRESWKNI